MLDEKLAPQQSRRIIGYLAQPLIHGERLFRGRRRARRGALRLSTVDRRGPSSRARGISLSLRLAELAFMFGTLGILRARVVERRLGIATRLIGGIGCAAARLRSWRRRLRSGIRPILLWRAARSIRRSRLAR